MSPKTAKTLEPGHFIASRLTYDPRRFTHVAEILRTTKKAIFAAFKDGPDRGKRIAFDDRDALARIRTADVAEVEGYKRWVR